MLFLDLSDRPIPTVGLRGWDSFVGGSLEDEHNVMEGSQVGGIVRHKVSGS